jgi:hypothetical protein
MDSTLVSHDISLDCIVFIINISTAMKNNISRHEKSQEKKLTTCSAIRGENCKPRF